jgi:hypothetical protein
MRAACVPPSRPPILAISRFREKPFLKVLGFFPARKQFYSGCFGEGIKVWGTETHRLLREYAFDSRILTCRFADEGTALYAASAARSAAYPDIHKLNGLSY